MLILETLGGFRVRVFVYKGGREGGREGRREGRREGWRDRSHISRACVSEGEFEV